MTIDSAAMRSNIVGLALIAPLVIFLAFTFLVPLGRMLVLSVSDTELAAIMPRSVIALASWDGETLPDEEAFAAVAADLAAAREDRTAGTAARRLGYASAEWRTVLSSTARSLPDDASSITNWQDTLVSIEPAWGQAKIWHALAEARGPFTDIHVLTALGMDGGPDSGLYVNVLVRTFVIAISATAICLLLAMPAAYLLSSVSGPLAGLLMLTLLLPLWTSVLVRSTSWLVILQKNGILNQILMALRITNAPLDLIYNRTGVLIALTHVLLPYAVLPLYAAMKSLPKSQMQASRSLGGGPLSGFFRVYLPQVLPGLSAGGLMVFILALGYYITPLLLGGQGDQMLPFYIAYNTLQALNWGLAASLAGGLLIVTVILYLLYVRLVGVERVRV
ncbi:putative spermidine/putrescine transport system permease protein [Devosia crocina]|uniref:Putative spermidine/putrescine transport system permease protein n=1 Tax=Devosia crocina TaxID=429728 RepID=A0A1I7MYT3_9HYPH|nr:ABC transporter permease [Devosia crocina]SFV27554.1 putative spermidine/putrescine transport system permease protein [Devosia crocina]